jgi:hypothetical protein
MSKSSPLPMGANHKSIASSYERGLPYVSLDGLAFPMVEFVADVLF